MRNPTDKICAILMTGALGVALMGCAGHVAFDSGGTIAPHEDYSFAEEGPWDSEGRVFRLPFTSRGEPYPDPRRLPVDGRQLRDAGYSLGRYFAENTEYDPSAILRDYARRIQEECHRDSAVLIVVVHGNDNTYSEAHRTFEAVRLRIASLLHRRPAVFLEVYWDAGCGSSMASWAIARPGSKYVGLGLRPLLSSLDGSIPVRILTHSRGASVACAALWNVPLRESKEEDAEYEERQRAITLPHHPNLRIGMIAPAMPTEDFLSCLDAVGRSPFERVILGINEDDPALNKGGLGPSIGGSTESGCRIRAFESTVDPLLNRDGTVAHAVDLSHSRDHDFKDYIMRRAFKEHFLPLLVDDAIPAVAGLARN